MRCAEYPGLEAWSLIHGKESNQGWGARLYGSYLKGNKNEHGTRAVQVIHERETQCSVPMNSCIFTWEKDELDRVRGKRQCMPRTIMLIISQHWAKPIKVRLVLPARIPEFVLFELQWKKSSTKASFGYVCMYLHKYAVVSQVPAKDAGTRP